MVVLLYFIASCLILRKLVEKKYLDGIFVVITFWLGLKIYHSVALERKIRLKIEVKFMMQPRPGHFNSFPLFLVADSEKIGSVQSLDAPNKNSLQTFASDEADEFY